MPTLTFSFYLGRQFLIWFGIAVLVCAIVGLIIDMGETSRIVSRGENTGFLYILGISLLKFPNLIQEALPFAFLFGAIGYFDQLNKNHELIVARASGLSVWQFLAPSIILTFFIGVLSIMIWHPMAAWTAGKAKNIEKNIAYGTTNQLSVSDNGLWLREDIKRGEEEIYAIIHAPQIMSADPIILRNVSYLSFTPDGTNLERIDAERAQLYNGRWILNRGWIMTPDAQAQKFASASRVTTLESKQIQENFVPPRTIPFWELPQFMEIAEAAGFPIDEYRMYFHALLAKPILLCAIVLTAAVFGLHFSRIGGRGRLIALAIIFGLGLFFFSDMMHTLGTIGLLPVPLAAWVPPAIAGLIGITLLLHQEDG